MSELRNAEEKLGPKMRQQALSLTGSIDFECDRPKGHSGQHAHGDMNGLVVVWGRP